MKNFVIDEPVLISKFEATNRSIDETVSDETVLSTNRSRRTGPLPSEHQEQKLSCAVMNRSRVSLVTDCRGNDDHRDDL